MQKTFVGVIGILIIFCSPLAGQDASKKFAKTITADDLKKHLTIIASDSFEGRGTGEHGQKLAAAYISNQFKEIGLKPPVQKSDSMSFFQSFTVYKKSWNEPYLKIGDSTYSFLKQFFSIANPDITEEEELDVVFGGYGMDDISKSKLDISGKAVVVLSGKHEDANTDTKKQKKLNLILTSNYNKKYREILNNGARAIFVVPGENDSLYHSFLENYKCTLEETEVFYKAKELLPNNTFFIPPSLVPQILDVDSTEFLQLAMKRESFTKSDLKRIKGNKIKIKASKIITPLETENVLGFIEGTDKKEEVLVITAHYDHEGIKCGEIYNGADDDGTGTSAILELAEAFSLAKKAGAGPRRSILFMTVTGEEKGLLGSAFYTKAPVFPLSQTVANLNIDMIGRIDAYHENEDYVYLIGSNRLSTQLHKVSESVNKKYTNIKLDYKYNALDDPNQFYYRSDHYNFAKNNIPVIFYFSGVHEDYHQPTDDIEKIIFSKVEKTTRLVFHTAWELANREERIVVDVK